jgi:hypothetical protein
VVWQQFKGDLMDFEKIYFTNNFIKMQESLDTFKNKFSSTEKKDLMVKLLYDRLDTLPKSVTMFSILNSLSETERKAFLDEIKALIQTVNESQKALKK